MARAAPSSGRTTALSAAPFGRPRHRFAGRVSGFAGPLPSLAHTIRPMKNAYCHLLLLALSLTVALTGCNPELVEPLSGITAKITDMDPGKPMVLVSLSATCPISLRQSLTIDTLVARYPEILFIGVFPKAETHADIDSFRQAVQPQYMLFSDPKNAVINMFDIGITPEVLVIDKSRTRILYRGAIDDRYEALGQHRKHPTRHYLENALQSIRRGDKPDPFQTKPIGCII